MDNVNKLNEYITLHNELIAKAKETDDIEYYQELLKKEEELLYPIILEALTEMKKNYKNRSTLYIENELYKKCRYQRNYRVLYPEYNISNVNVLMNTQNTDFQKAHNLFILSAGYLHLTQTPSTPKESGWYTLHDALDRIFDNKITSLCYANGQTKASGFEYKDEMIECYFNLKLCYDFFYGDKTYAYDEVKAILFGLLRPYTQKAFYLITEIDKNGHRMTDAQIINRLSLVRMVMQTECFDITEISNLTDQQSEELMKLYNTLHPRRKKPFSKEYVKFITNTDNLILADVNANKEGTFNTDCKLQFNNIQITDDEKTLSDDDYKIYQKLLKRLAEKTFKNVRDEDRDVLLRRSALLSMGYTEDVIENIIARELGQKNKKFDYLVSRVYGQHSAFYREVNKIKANDIIPEPSTVEKDELIQMVLKDVLIGNPLAVIQALGLDPNNYYKERK